MILVVRLHVCHSSVALRSNGPRQMPFSDHFPVLVRLCWELLWYSHKRSLLDGYAQCRLEGEAHPAQKLEIDSCPFAQQCKVSELVSTQQPSSVVGDDEMAGASAGSSHPERALGFDWRHGPEWLASMLCTGRTSLREGPFRSLSWGVVRATGQRRPRIELFGLSGHDKPQQSPFALQRWKYSITSAKKFSQRSCAILDFLWSTTSQRWSYSEESHFLFLMKGTYCCASIGVVYLDGDSTKSEWPML
jgi:hypothetical protein